VLTPTTRAIRVLLADDEPAVRQALGAVLAEEEGLELVAMACDAEEAIALAVRHRPDVALVDVRMPAGGGPRVAREIQLRSPETVVVALSANGDRDSVFRMLEAGALGYLVKGGRARDVVETIKRSARREAALSPEVAPYVIGRLSRDLRHEREASERRLAVEERIHEALSGSGLTMALQPIVLLDTRETVGYEALARFDLEPRQGPDRWFADAELVGLRRELEIEAIRRALLHLAVLPPQVFLSLNTNPRTLVSSMLPGVLSAAPVDRIVLEVTEDAPIDDYEEFAEAIADLRRRGLRLAVDDAGAGFASLRHILLLEPDLIKIDGSLTEHIDTNVRSRALAVALTSFARETGAGVIAEAIERDEQLQALHEIGVTYGQGYLRGRPGRPPGSSPP
jgi:EAL domain-containing protein (putative c-di-GMP-specific phosphodiesterase class I)/CheY-like chemotaxis protein